MIRSLIDGWREFWGMSWWGKGPVLGIVVTLIVVIIVVAAATGGDDGGAEDAVSGIETTETEAPTSEPTEPLAAEPTPEPTVEPTPEPTPTEEPETERIVPAVPGAVAEAEGVQITLNEIIDPWISTAEFAFDEPGPGNRFVAMDITIQYTKDSGTHFACDINFRLTDAEAFAYDAAILIDLEPSLKCIDLGGGQKTRGWMGFEIGGGAIMDLLKYDPDFLTTNDIEFQFQ